MLEKPLITTEEADARVRSVSEIVCGILDGFNADNPDPDAREVASKFRRVKLSYIRRVCASVLAAKTVLMNKELSQYEIDDAELDSRREWRVLTIERERRERIARHRRRLSSEPASEHYFRVKAGRRRGRAKKTTGKSVEDAVEHNEN